MIKDASMRAAIFAAGFLQLLGALTTGAQEWQGIEGGRFKDLIIPQKGKTGFTLLAPSQTGVLFTNTVSEWQSAANRVLLDGSGAAVGDYDGDGRPDIFLCSLNGRNTLYRNLGDWRFADVTEASGLNRDQRSYRGAVFADVNGDGALDLLITVLGGGVECFLNGGQGKFSHNTAPARTASKLGSMTLALADVDGNGTLDLYVANNRAEDIRDKGQVNLRIMNGQMVVPPEWKDRLMVMNGQVLEYGEPDQLYLNDGRGRFTPVSWTGGRFRDENGGPLMAPPLDWGLTATFRDINGDGFPDLYVCNDFWTPDRVWLNDGKGRFRAIQRLAFRNMPASSMGVDFADVDRDGFVDCFVVDMLSRDPRLRKRQKLAQAPMSTPVGVFDDRPQFMRNTLYRNLGDGTFAEMANYAGVAASEWSWSPIFLDVDLDGYEDLLITSGHARDVQDLDAQAEIQARQHSWQGFATEAERQKAFTQELMEHMRLYPRLETPIIAFRNLGTMRFEEATAAWGTDQPGVHHAMATGDLDGDGDLDLIVNNLGSPAGIYRNDSMAPRIAVRLKGAAANSQAIGARLKLLGATVGEQSQEVISGGRYLAGSDPQLTFAPGRVEDRMTLEIQWRSGKTSRIGQVRANRLYEVSEPSGQTAPGNVPKPARAPALFVDAGDTLTHRHHEESFDDFAAQPLLPFKRSQQGPGVAWFDLDGDGNEELFIGTGRGGALGAFRIHNAGRFEAIPGSESIVLPGDSTGLAGWVTASGRRGLLAGVTAYESGAKPGLWYFTMSEGRLVATNLVSLAADGVGSLAVADLDGDGDLDVFLGGTVRQGRYPEATGSRILRCVGEQLEPDNRNTAAVAKAGLVNGAVWSDLNGDGFPELILACEWGPVRVLANRGGELTEDTERLGLSAWTGWWNGVTTGDLDGDGRLDIVASNWGWNSPYRASAAMPLRLYHGDFSGAGALDLLETEYDPATRELTPRRSLTALAATMPFLQERYRSHKAFSEAGLQEVLGDRANQAKLSEATTLASMIFYNRGDHFAEAVLPTEAQLSPAFAPSVADLDGDGREDVFLSQNFFATQPELPRLDAGRGLWLRGNEKGELVAVLALASGLDIAGEQRGAALADFDRDGRVDLIVSQNGAHTRLFRNQGAQRGLRIRLIGPRGNPDGIGATIQWRSSTGRGPLREIHGGSGHDSQDSAIQILGRVDTGAELTISWPGGLKSTVKPEQPAGILTIQHP